MLIIVVLEHSANFQLLVNIEAMHCNQLSLVRHNIIIRVAIATE